jgi:hypothetical protein
MARVHQQALTQQAFRPQPFRLRFLLPGYQGVQVVMAAERSNPTGYFFEP